MLAMTAANGLAAVVFGVLYLVGALRPFARGAFLSCLLVLFLLMTGLWVCAEAQSRNLEPLRRVGRVVLGLLAVVVGLPMVVLTPMFWLDSMLPPEAGFTDFLAPSMTILLFALLLLLGVNVVGSAVVLGRAVVGRRSGPGPRPERTER